MPSTVTVLLSAYNDRRFIADSIQSVLRQRFTEFELLAIDDASTDGTDEFLRSVADPRIRCIFNERNLGLTACLNRGLAFSRGRYIARMDADDVCEIDRLAEQVAFLDAHPDIGVVGTSRTLIDEAGHHIGLARAVEDDRPIRWKCLVGNPFAHPTVLLRRSVLETHALKYDESFRTAQDYELWTRLLRHTRGANLSQPLVKYRLRHGASRTSGAEQLANHDRIALLAIQRLLPGFIISPEQVRHLRGRFGGYSVRDASMNPDDPNWVDFYSRLRAAFDTAYPARPAGAAA